MNNPELYLKTVFCCMACDGNIADEEVGMIRKLVSETNLFAGIDVESTLNKYILEINEEGACFLNNYLNEVSNENLSEDEQLKLIGIAIKTIEADNRIEYSEIKFFKKIRFRLSVSDDMIIGLYPDRDDFLLPDNKVTDAFEFDDVKFANISVK